MEGQRNIVEQIVINSIEDYKKTQRRVEDLLEGEVSKSRVVTLARSLAAGEGQKMNVDHLRACIYTEAGVRLKDTSLIEEGIQIWEGFMGWTPELGQRRGQVKRDSRCKV